MKRIKILDIIKGVCIILVLLHHFSWSTQENLQFLFPFWVKMAVPVFMIISGHNYAMSLDRNNAIHMEDAYEATYILKKILRYTIPFAFAFAVEMVYSGFFGGFSFSTMYKTFLKGGVGPGSYYYPCLLQMIFLMPLLYYPIRKNPNIGLMYAFFANAIYEILKDAFELGDVCYRLLIFRYIFALSCGCYFYFMKDRLYQEWKTRKYFLSLMGGGIIGVIYITAYNYFHFIPSILQYWTGTSFISVLYAFPVFIVLYKLFEGKRILFLELIGKYSYEIFLTQMVFYEYFSTYVYQAFASRSACLMVWLISCMVVGVAAGIITQPVTKIGVSMAEAFMNRHKKAVNCE